MKGVLMTKMVQELNLTNLTPEIDLSDMRIMTAEINRPALQLTGYLEHFANERVQIIGYVEYTYLMQLSDEKRMNISPFSGKPPFAYQFRPKEGVEKLTGPTLCLFHDTETCGSGIWTEPKPFANP